MKILSQRIKEERMKLELNQKDFGAKLKVSKQAVSGWENDYRSPDVETLNELSELFNCTSDYLLGKTDKPTNDLVDVINNTQEYIFNFKSGEKKVAKEEIQEIIDKFESMQEFMEKFMQK